MRAVLCKRWGDPAVLSLERVEPTALATGDIRISVHAAGVNFADRLMVAGRYQLKPPFPFSPGFEVSGTVIETGEGVHELKPGDRVLAALLYGGYAEEVVVPATHVLPIPKEMDFPTAAALPAAYGTAQLALAHRAHLRSGDILLVYGAAGNVGKAAIEIGKRMGATVIAGAGSREHLEMAVEHGADCLIDYAQDNIRNRVLEITDGRGADVVFDPVGGDAFDAALRCVAWEGTILTIGFASGRVPKAPAWRILVRNCAVVGIDWSGYLKREPETLRTYIAEVIGGHAKGAINPQPLRLFPLARVTDALRAQAARQTTGKVVLTTARD